MIPLEQTRIGNNGNCFAACLAGMCNERKLPEFGSDDKYWDRVDAYLARRGLRYKRVPLSTKPLGYGTIEGISPRGGLHACVAKNGEMVHDPHPVSDDPRRGLVTPKWYGVLLPLPLSKKAKDADDVEYVLWGLPRGSNDRLDEKVLFTQGKTAAQIDAIKAKAARDGWHSFRVQRLNLSTKPNFASKRLLKDALRIDTDGSVHPDPKPAQQLKRWATKRFNLERIT